MREVGSREGFGQPRRRLICFFCFATPAPGGEAIFVRVMRVCLNGIYNKEEESKRERRGLGMEDGGIEDGKWRCRVHWTRGSAEIFSSSVRSEINVGDLHTLEDYSQFFKVTRRNEGADGF